MSFLAVVNDQVKHHHLTFPDAPKPREAIYRQGNPTLGGGFSTYRIVVNEGREDAHTTIIHFMEKAGSGFGVTTEDLLAIALDRLECFQKGEFPCEENDVAIQSITYALSALKERSRRRYLKSMKGKYEEEPYVQISVLTPVPLPATDDAGQHVRSDEPAPKAEEKAEEAEAPKEEAAVPVEEKPKEEQVKLEAVGVEADGSVKPIDQIKHEAAPAPAHHRHNKKKGK